MDYLFVYVVFIYTASSTTVIAQSENEYENTLERTKMAIEDRWIWGVAEPITYAKPPGTTDMATLQARFQLTTVTPKPPGTTDMATLQARFQLTTATPKPPGTTDMATLQARFQLTTATPVTTTKLENENCKPYNPSMPDFRAPNRRISEVKCQEYIWKAELISTQEERKRNCDPFEKFDDYFLGGLPALPHQFPHMGAVGWKSVKGTWVFKCGSFLISSNFVVTAAHCTSASEADADLADIYPKIIRLGHENIDSEFPDEDRRIDVNISSILTYPSYKSPLKYNDIALMKLAKKVEFSNSIAPACLWVSNDITKLGNIGTVAGWGVLKEGSFDISLQLQTGQLTVIDTEKCNNLLKKFCNRNWCGVDNNQICAGNLTGGVDACQGDSGAPLQVKIPSKSEWNFYHVIGVTSFGIGCGQPKVPGVYTKISSFIDWIENIVWPSK